ncbi:winged helix-turn-helix domain-containing protein [Streptomyces sp. NPDC006463]|uniref:AfsR/SARP family transcriptional regulator n=1 Tax=Streptomyces sp. NPDC006463 TaxID=3364746 RepID=UPI00369AD019
MPGALEARGEDGAGPGVGGARLRTLLILLALEPGRLVASELLIDGIWENDPPMGAANALQALVSRLRRALPGVAVESHPAGYRLVVEPDDVDVTRFERARRVPRAPRPRDQPGAARPHRRGPVAGAPDGSASPGRRCRAGHVVRRGPAAGVRAARS